MALQNIDAKNTNKKDNMKEILQNLALIHLNKYGMANGIDISGTHVAKNGRGFSWSLVKNDTGRTLVTVFFHKASIPTYTINQ